MVLAVFAAWASVAAAADGTSLSQRRPGFFEVSGPDLAWVHSVDARAEEVHAGLALLLELPPRYTTPVFVRIQAADPVAGRGGFRLGIEPAGIVTLAITPGPETTDVSVRHALARALLLRHAAWLGGFSPDLGIPAWLEEAGVAASLVAGQPAMAEALGREAARHGPLPLAALLSGGQVEALAGWQANTWLLAQFLRSEMGGEAWREFLRVSLRGGTDSGVAVSRALGRSGANPELAWSAGFFNLAERHGGPGQSVQESYRTVTRAAQFVFRAGGRDTVFPWERLWFWRESPVVRRELEARARALPVHAPSAHPFFVNAFASLQDAFAALLAADQKAYGEAISQYEDDLAAAIDLTFAAEAALEETSAVR